VTKALPALGDDSDFTACVAFAAAGEDVLRDSKPAARLIALTAFLSLGRKPRAPARLQRIQAEGWTWAPGSFDRDSLHER
jgi:hypothetical protein